MRLHFACVVSLVALTNVTLVGQTGFPADNTSYLSWNTKMIKTITKKYRVNGQVGGSFDFRIRNTERSYNYKLRATWFTPGNGTRISTLLATAGTVERGANPGLSCGSGSCW